MDYPLFIIYSFVFIFGSLVGSFLNVCIWRMPREESIISPGSHCPKCNHSIKWYDNIPLVSLILLKAECRYCKAGISFRYFLIELLTASLFVLFFYYFRTDLPRFFIYIAVVSSLIAATFIDFDYQIIPDEITLGGLAAGIIVSLVYPYLHQTPFLFESWPLWRRIGYSGFQSVLGALAGGGSIYLIGVAGTLAFKKESMGGGDVKLMAMLGAFMGWKMVLLTFFIAPFFGSVVGIIMKIKTKAEIMPYGPYLSLAAIISMIWGQEILSYFFSIG
ncbi:MAG: prepilin peptidase [Candidatus Omnitrophica bacterium]|nr:prepilin peptidase [Candidatus Omnitrophota bacterium]